MRKNLLLAASIGSLLYPLWVGWQHFQGVVDRESFLTQVYVFTLVWFLSATTWASMGPKKS